MTQLPARPAAGPNIGIATGCPDHPGAASDIRGDNRGQRHDPLVSPGALLQRSVQSSGPALVLLPCGYEWLRTGEDLLYGFQGRAPRGRASGRRNPAEVRARAGRDHGGWSAGRARCAHGALTAPRLAAPPLRLRHTAGCRPSATPDNVRHQLAAVTPADRGPSGTVPSSRRPSMKPRKTAVKGALRASLA